MSEAQKKLQNPRTNVLKICEAKILGYVINLPYASVFQFASPIIILFSVDVVYECHQICILKITFLI